MLFLFLLLMMPVSCHLSFIVGVTPGGVGDVKREGWLAEDGMHAWVIVAKYIVPSLLP
jgi:hypothetical protein